MTNPGFDASLNAVQSSQADAVLAGMTITDARKQIFDFSDPYYTSNIRLAVAKGSKVKSYKDLKGKTVGAKMVRHLTHGWKTTLVNMALLFVLTMKLLLCTTA